MAQDPVLATTADMTPYLERIQKDGRAQVVMVATERGRLRQRVGSKRQPGTEALRAVPVKTVSCIMVFIIATWFGSMTRPLLAPLR